MAAGSYLEKLDRVTGFRRHAGRVSRLTGDSETVLGSHALATYVRGAGEQTRIGWGVGTAAGAVAGTILGARKGHWLLGALSGGSIFTNVPALLRPHLRKEAFWNLLQTHGAIAGSLVMPNNRFLGFGLVYLLVGVARLYYGDQTR